MEFPESAGLFYFHVLDTEHSVGFQAFCMICRTQYRMTVQGSLLKNEEMEDHGTLTPAWAPLSAGSCVAGWGAPPPPVKLACFALVGTQHE